MSYLINIFLDSRRFFLEKIKKTESNNKYWNLLDTSEAGISMLDFQI